MLEKRTHEHSVGDKVAVYPMGSFLPADTSLTDTFLRKVAG